MARPLRPAAPGLVYHVTARGNERQDITRDDDDRRTLLGRLDGVVRERDWRVATWCLMPNHLHLLAKTPEPDLSTGLQEALGGYARRFNDRHDRSGHLFQGRFHTVVVTSDAHHLVLHRYIARNPVRAGLCAEPGHWRWSAHNALSGVGPSLIRLDSALGPFGGDPTAYADFVRAGTGALLPDLVLDGSPRCLRAALDAGFSQREVAAAAGMSQPTLSRRLRE